MAKIFVNEEKRIRAKAILDLVVGSSVPKNQDQTDTRAKFSAFFQEDKVDPKKEGALEYVYEKLGGLLRSVEEQKAAEARKVEMQAKAKKRKIE